VFLRLPFEFSPALQQTALVVNTIILIVALVVAELTYSEVSPERRQQLRHFLPLFIVLGGLLLYAIFKQVAHV
jgi:hypothetical protein